MANIPLLPCTSSFLGCFHVLCFVVKTAAVNIGYMYLFELWSSLNICSRVGLLAHRVVLFLVFKGISVLFSIVIVPIYISTSCIKRVPFFSLSTFIILDFFMILILNKCEVIPIVGLICISPSDL